MTTNTEGLNLIKSLEGCRLTAYKLKGESKYTIGYGHSDSTIKAGQTITQAEADALLVSDLKKFENYVTKYAVAKFPSLNENQFSALVSYCYNRGLKGLKELVNLSDTIAMMSDNIPILWGSNTNYKTALINRRKKEQALFNKSTVVVSNVSRETFVIPTPTLKRGSKGTQVNYLQKCLNHYGYGLDVDGHFGEKTYRALADFQKKHSLTIDGVYGKHTRDTLRSELNGN